MPQRHPWLGWIGRVSSPSHSSAPPDHRIAHYLVQQQLELVLCEHIPSTPQLWVHKLGNQLGWLVVPTRYDTILDIRPHSILNHIEHQMLHTCVQISSSRAHESHPLNINHSDQIVANLTPSDYLTLITWVKAFFLDSNSELEFPNACPTQSAHLLLWIIREDLVNNHVYLILELQYLLHHSGVPFHIAHYFHPCHPRSHSTALTVTSMDSYQHTVHMRWRQPPQLLGHPLWHMSDVASGGPRFCWISSNHRTWKQLRDLRAVVRIQQAMYISFNSTSVMSFTHTHTHTH